MKKILLIAFAAACVGASAETIYGLTANDRLIAFDSATPGSLMLDVAISGLAAGETLHGIDIRPLTGQLYGVSSANKLYVVDKMTGSLSGVGSGFAPPLNGTSFGFDFNPTVDRIRVTSDIDENRRLNPLTGGNAATDLNLNYKAGDANFGANPNIVGSAYTRNFPGGGTTTLYNIDSLLGILAKQTPPNDGALETIGSLGVATSDFVGFDISGYTAVPYASLTTPGSAGSSLYTINLMTGAATLVGGIGGTTAPYRLKGISAVPEPATFAVFGLGALVLLRRRKKA